LLMVGRYPMAVLFCVISPKAWTSMFIRPKPRSAFPQADRLFSSVQNAVRRALLAHSPVPGIGDEAALGAWPIPNAFSTTHRPAWDMAGRTTPDLGSRNRPTCASRPGTNISASASFSAHAIITSVGQMPALTWSPRAGWSLFDRPACCT
jgi:hypothetical protein